MSIVISLLIMLISVVIHEVAHGVVAEKLGDPTARRLGRITLNPIKHIDPFMSILMPTLLVLAHSPVILGGAKPVPVNPNFFKNPRYGMAIVAIAGPISNLLIALILGIALKFAIQSPGIEDSLLIRVLFTGILMNIALAIFNMIPVPPLDGSRVLAVILPEKLSWILRVFEKYGLIFVFGLLYLGFFDAIFAPIQRHLIHLFGG